MNLHTSARTSSPSSTSKAEHTMSMYTLTRKHTYIHVCTIMYSLFLSLCPLVCVVTSYHQLSGPIKCIRCVRMTHTHSHKKRGTTPVGNWVSTGTNILLFISNDDFHLPLQRIRSSAAEIPRRSLRRNVLKWNVLTYKRNETTNGDTVDTLRCSPVVAMFTLSVCRRAPE